METIQTTVEEKKCSCSENTGNDNCKLKKHLTPENMLKASVLIAAAGFLYVMFND